MRLQEIGPQLPSPRPYPGPCPQTAILLLYKGREFPEFKGHALITSLKDQSLRLLDFTKLNNIKEKIIFKNNIGRIRDIKIHPKNGKIFLLAQDKLWLFEKK